MHQPIDFDHAKRDRTHWPRQLQPREPAHFLWPNGPGKQKMHFLRLSLITKVPAAFLHTKFKILTELFEHLILLLLLLIPSSHSQQIILSGNTKGGSITVLLTSCLTGLD